MKDLERMKHSWKSCGKYGKYCSWEDKRKESHDEAITYAWPEDATYETLNVDIITTSILRAKVMNEAKSQGHKDKSCLNKKQQQECFHKLIGIWKKFKRDLVQTES